jgi:hypothetical protein
VLLTAVAVQLKFRRCCCEAPLLTAKIVAVVELPAPKLKSISPPPMPTPPGSKEPEESGGFDVAITPLSVAEPLPHEPGAASFNLFMLPFCRVEKESR